MQKKYLVFASVSGFLCVALGAFGAHALKQKLSPELLSAFETGVRYQFYHTLVILFICLLPEKYQGKFIIDSSRAFVMGIIFFSLILL